MTTQLDSNPDLKAAPLKRIMIVEDESVIALDIIASLTKLGYDVAGVAASGDSALRKIQSSRPDLILMDIHLKGEMTGIDVSERVKSEFQIPIVYLTANADDSTFKQANQTDPYGYLLKPFEERELSIAVEIALHKHEKEQVIRSSEHWYATAFQSLSEAVIATDSRGNVIFMNAMAESITNWSLQEALDRPITSVLTFRRNIQKSGTTHSSQDISLRSVSSILKSILEGTDVVQLPLETQLLSRSMQTIPIAGHAVAIRDTTGYITGCLLTFRAPAVTSRTNPPSAVPSASKERSSLSIATPNATKQSIGDREIDAIKTFVDSFVREQPTRFSSGDLVADYDQTAATLTSQTEGNVVTGKLVRDKQTAIVKRNSNYWEAVCHTLIENNFFPVGQRTNGTCYFQYCIVPKDCQVYRTSALELWHVWNGKACPADGQAEATSTAVSRANLMVLRRGSWYHIQSLSLSDDIIQIKTIGGEIFISTHERLVWGTQRWK